MNTIVADPTGRRRPTRRFTRPLLTAAIACFTLPFLTVTCYGDDVTLSGVQAATTVDLTPQAKPDPGDRQFADEQEPPNLFAFIALVATMGALALAFGSSGLGRIAVRVAAAAAIALVALFLYAFSRTTGYALPDVGLTSAIALLVAAAWAGTDTVPRWVVWAIGVAALGTIPYSMLGSDAQMDVPWGFIGFYAGGIAMVALAVGAIRASVDPDLVRTGTRATPVRIVITGVVAAVCLGIGGFVAPALMMGLAGGGMETTVGGGYAFATLAIGSVVGTSFVAWVTGRRIVGGHRATVAAWDGAPPMPVR